MLRTSWSTHVSVIYISHYKWVNWHSALLSSSFSIFLLLSLPLRKQLLSLSKPWVLRYPGMGGTGSVSAQAPWHSCLLSSWIISPSSGGQGLGFSMATVMFTPEEATMVPRPRSDHLINSGSAFLGDCLVRSGVVLMPHSWTLANETVDRKALAKINCFPFLFSQYNWMVQENWFHTFFLKISCMTHQSASFPVKTMFIYEHLGTTSPCVIFCSLLHWNSLFPRSWFTKIAPYLKSKHVNCVSYLHALFF